MNRQRPFVSRPRLVSLQSVLAWQRGIAFGVLWLLALSASLQAAHGQAQTRPTPARFLQWSYQDIGTLAVDMSTQAPLFLSSAGVLAAASRLDATLLQGVQSRDEGPVAPFLDVANELGNARVPLLAAGLFGASLATDDTRFQDAAFTSLQSLVYARLLTNTIKGIAGRSRPAAQAGVHRFDPFSGRTSFPSGHTTTAFALVTPWVLYYPHPITYGLFALSTGTALARIAHNRHWPSDVVAGAAIGFFVARYLTRLHQGQPAYLENVSVTPSLGTNAVGLSLRLQID